MVSCVVKNWQGEQVGEVNFELAPVARPETAQHVVHRAVVYQLQNQRKGTASTLTRGEVRGGGRKPWRQKGTGRARAGSIRSPLWRGGGVIFGPKPRDYSIKMNRKERRLALRTAFMSRTDDLLVVEDFSGAFSCPKTKEMVAALQRWGINWEEDKVLLILPSPIPEVVWLSARNIPTVKVLPHDQLNVYDILYADKIVATPEALSKIQEVYCG